MFRKFTIVLGLCLCTTKLLAQNSLQKQVEPKKNFKIGGYVQLEADYGQEFSHLNVGAVKLPEKSAIGVRRGYLSFVYDRNLVGAKFVVDITERGFGLIDGFLSVKSPFHSLNQSFIKLGVFQKPFGHEIAMSSSLRMSPERARVINTLFPGMADVGAMLVLQANKKSPWSIFKLEEALIAGDGVHQESDNRRDLITHLVMEKSLNDNTQFRLGVSHYLGYRRLADGRNLYKFVDHQYQKSETSDKYVLRQYFGVEAMFQTRTLLGETKIEGEYLQGQQPSLANTTRSLTSLVDEDLYLRSFRGGYVILSQGLGKLPFTTIFKYDYYDPNTKISGNAIGQENTNFADISYHTFGLGLRWNIMSRMYLQAYYSISRNETSKNLVAYDKDRKDNLLSLRLQYKF